MNPFRLRLLKSWFEKIKTFDGKKPNVFENSGNVYSVRETLEIIEENHKFYKALKSDEVMKKNSGFWIS